MPHTMKSSEWPIALVIDIVWTHTRALQLRFTIVKPYLNDNDLDDASKFVRDAPAPGAGPRAHTWGGGPPRPRPPPLSTRRIDTRELRDPTLHSINACRLNIYLFL